MTYYWSIASTDPAVYHWYDDCETGKQILASNKRTGTNPPSDRRACKDCPENN